jgi:hypothetical protein
MVNNNCYKLNIIVNRAYKGAKSCSFYWKIGYALWLRPRGISSRFFYCIGNYKISEVSKPIYFNTF